MLFNYNVSPWRIGLEQFRSSVTGPLACRTRGLNSVVRLTVPQIPRLRVTTRWTSLPRCSQVVTSAGQRPEFCIPLSVMVTFPYSEGNIFKRDVYKRIYYQSIIYYLWWHISAITSDNYVDLSDIYVDSSNHYVDFSEKYTHN